MTWLCACQLCAKFLVEDPDPETMRAELKQAFRLFDKECTVSTFLYLYKKKQDIRIYDPGWTEWADMGSLGVT